MNNDIENWTTPKHFPHHKIINEMEGYVDRCDFRILDSMRYFLKQSQGEYSPSQAIQFKPDTISKINELIHKFKTNCKCDKVIYRY